MVEKSAIRILVLDDEPFMLELLVNKPALTRSLLERP